MKMRWKDIRISRWSSVLAAMFLVVAIAALPAAAATMNYGDFAGSTVTFGDVTEDTLDPGPLVFGSPTVLNDSLIFTPTGFGATSENGQGAVGVDSQITTTLTGRDGPIDRIIIREFGDFTLRGSDGEVTVGAPVRWRVQEINGAPVAGPLGSGNMSFTPAGSGGNGVWQLGADQANGQLWDGVFEIDVTQFLADNNIEGQATKVQLIFDNVLTATSNSADTFAFVKKKDADIGVMITVPIPEPASATLFLLGMIGLLAARRRVR